ncbi:SGNH/GDSL hydrolase family protein [Calycomorphotria hydatis]|uniref:SGNH hydrolase-type esterase domain-containing protein n=1 Tax=Calycomorphotria hydatis TaxID=2528027 RepID=A0A517TF55_9PLAN|nr:SGNH/GDSL hydrolase family protein [Calycomorphotria hydatis]QDT66997.1 hypothetical protein V22_42690 [Calycomorphotria hydatis]
MLRTLLTGLLIISATQFTIAEDVSNPSVANIQRTMSRIAASTPENPATIRWEFYGQSITAQGWTKIVEADLKERFPSVNFIFHKPAIGGFTSPALIRTAEHDLYPWYPDLLVFHVYGPVDKYEEIIRRTRERTTAEIVLWTSHLNKSETLDKDPDNNDRIVAIRDVAKRYDCMLIDARKNWIEYLQEHNLEPAALLKDSVHLNEDGVKLLGSIVSAELKYEPSLQTGKLSGEIRELTLDSPNAISARNGDLIVKFKGNRVTLISDGTGTTPVEVLLDNKKLDDQKEQWAATRPSAAPKMWMPAFKQVTFENTPVEEKWTLTCLPDSTSDGSKIHFRVEGSVTGEDGEGYSTERFVSKSGRVVIEPKDWHVQWCLGYRKIELPEGFQVRWATYPLHTSKYSPQPAGTETVLVQGCENGDHQLTLRGGAQLAGIKAFRIDEPVSADELPKQ